MTADLGDRPADLDQAVQALQTMIDASRRLVFFGGAGVSTESGIPDFRSQDGLYSQQYDFPPETILSRTFFEDRPDQFFRFYRDRVLHPEAQPNPAHLKLAELERAGRLRAIVTQNIDGLHQAAGSVDVIELHGSVHRNHCRRCGRSFSLAQVMEGTAPPRCPCGGTVQPDVVLYEDPLDSGTIAAALDAIRQADCLIIGGTSLVVYPAAGLVDHFQGRRLAVVNRSGAGGRRADLVVTEPIGQVFARLRA
ncbi:MAG: NAD-dependent protein deacylase [Propionibacteriaceae bacterium]|jgi:NAD-dependent deacetylase|nr:NAD-dependent protein deacylase [Propionibacteriaceae bacterium]